MGWLDYEPISKIIRQPAKHINWPIGMPGQFHGTSQPQIPTCRKADGFNATCPKAAECPIAQAGLTHLGPGMVILKKRDAVTAMECYHYFGAHDQRGWQVHQINMVDDGWKMDTSRTTIPVMGSVPVMNRLGQKTGEIRRGDWEKEVPDLLPYWWPLLKKQGKPLPEAALHYPQFAEDDEEEQSTQPQSQLPEPSRSVSRGGRKKRRKVGKRSGTASRSARSAPPSSDTPVQDA